MKKYTHAWLAMMAMKRIEKAIIPAKQKDDAKALITWFKNYRDFVISGAWYPDIVLADMSTSHIAKYMPDPTSTVKTFHELPETMQLYKYGLESKLYGQPYYLDKRHNICDRCEAFTESLIDSFKILTTENEGSPIVPSNNHIAMRFFILSHYIADCHMPLHCDGRHFPNKNEVHTFIEEEWDKQVQSSYYIDEDNNRFYYDPYGYPLKQQIQSELIKYVEKELETREFVWPWGGEGCTNTWSYMSGVSQYSYLMAYRLVPADREPDKITRAYYKKSKAFTEHFTEYSKVIMADAVESIAKVWLHAWVRYRDWFRGTELAYYNAQMAEAEKNLSKAEKAIDNYDADKEALVAKVNAAREKVLIKEEDLRKATEAGRKTEKKSEEYENARIRLAKEQSKLDDLERFYKISVEDLDKLKALVTAAKAQYDNKDAEINRYKDSKSGI